jgi:hypothetical protein
MTKERYNQIVDEVFKKYADSHWTPPENPNGPLLLDQLWSLKPMQHSKESFIQSCKTDNEFSEKWGLKIEERELSLDERKQIFDDRGYVCDVWPFNGDWHGEYDGFRIPRRAISLTYNNETIEVYG